MTLQKGSALDSSLDVGNTSESSTQLESFPPLAPTRSNVLNSPALGREAVDPMGVPPGESNKRWWILLLSCLLLFGNYFAYDNPAALNTQLQKYLDMPYNDYQYLLSTLYSVYSLPNTVLPFFFGTLVDRFGPQAVLLGLSSCVCIGQTIFALGVQSRQVWMMLVGRAIFGIGGESCGVAQASITTMQFKGHELAFALGLNLCIARFGSVVNTLITPWAEQRWGVPTAIWIGTLSCVASFMSAVVLVNVIDTPRRQPELESTETTALTPLLTTLPETVSSNTLYRADSTNAADCASSRSSSAYSPTQASTQQPLPGPLRRGVNFSDSVHILLYGTVVPFNNIASDFLQSKWYPGNPRKAAAVMGIPDTLGAVLVPGFGMLVDRYGDSFLPVEMFFIAMGVCGMLVGFLLKNIDRHSGGALEKPEIRVEVPVLVPQPTMPSASVSGSAITSPVLSQGRSAFSRRRQRPVLSCIQTTGHVSGLGLRRVESPAEEWGPTLSRRGENDDTSPVQEYDANSDNEIEAANNSGHHGACRTSSSPESQRPMILPVSPMTERNRRRWFGERRPLLRRTLTRVGSPLLQQYAGSPRYGSFSSPSLASVAAGDRAFYWGSEDVESRLPGSEAFVEDYSVSQHPILYNPLRGSSGSFRISRSARPVVFSEGEEGLVYVDEQAVRGSGCDDGGDVTSGAMQQTNASLQHRTEIADDDDNESTTVTSSNNGDVNDTHVEIDARQDYKN
ncbi:hypothetical protein BGZ70_007003 [Mortierella alpina]|uniref:Lysosomal dipeptide transporter MFSD1 n=1 Tax=Mortierella alpina TaxID=64518 RepID=A0A9P6JAG1_MORAP|nr:hypothetical protein BGZ70_007003 [Mortierella alpina]